MPYVPSTKTDGKSTDRTDIDAKVKLTTGVLAGRIKNNLDVADVYFDAFKTLGESIVNYLLAGIVVQKDDALQSLAFTIVQVGKRYDYDGAFLGELNYATTRLIQQVPQEKVNRGEWEQSLRYFVYALTVDALTRANLHFSASPFNKHGIAGVFEDIKDEYKRRVNTAYEAAQIIKSGDCYDTPYYTRLFEVVDELGTHVGYQEVMLKRSEKTLNKDVVGKIVVKI